MCWSVKNFTVDSIHHHHYNYVTIPCMKKVYKWDQWFAQGHFVLWKGTDYTCTSKNVVQQARNAGAFTGYKVSAIEVKEDHVEIKVVKRNKRG